MPSRVRRMCKLSYSFYIYFKYFLAFYKFILMFFKLVEEGGKPKCKLSLRLLLSLPPGKCVGPVKGTGLVLYIFNIFCLKISTHKQFAQSFIFDPFRRFFPRFCEGNPESGRFSLPRSPDAALPRPAAFHPYYIETAARFSFIRSETRKRRKRRPPHNRTEQRSLRIHSSLFCQELLHSPQTVRNRIMPFPAVMRLICPDP